jgi:hypothetical protein
VLLGYAAPVAAWIWGSPAGAAPDEEAHYVRAAAVGQGELVGEPVAIDGSPGSNPTTLEWVREVSRAVTLPAALAPPDFAGCFANRPAVSAACTRTERAPAIAERLLTYVAVYQPVPYLAPGLLTRLASNPWQALFLGRLATAVTSLALLALAVAVLREGRRDALALAGLLLAASPMLVFLASVVSSSGLELTSAVCFVAGLARAGESRPSRTAALALGAGGFVLATARPFGPLWVVLAIAALGDALAQQVGWFGWLDTRLPDGFYAAWFAALALLVGAALVLGTWRHRVALVALCVAGCLLAIAVGAVLVPLGGGETQGRYTMPFTMAVPLLAGEVVYRRREGLGVRARRALLLAIGLVVVLGQLTAWWLNARRYAVGTAGPWLFLSTPGRWDPPPGWVPLAALAALGAGCLAAGLLAAPDRRLRYHAAAVDHDR